jgi:hypothetical protein
MEWISVEDRLPDNGDSIIGYSSLDERVEGGEYSYCLFQKYHCLYFSREGYMVITHWMPLPEPPEDAK